jgi:FixJ family two-component response regulator
MPFRRAIYLVDNDATWHDGLSWSLNGFECRVERLASGAALLAAAVSAKPACAILDVCLPGESAVEILERLATERPDLPVIFVAAHCDLATAVSMMRRGAVDFLTRPIDAALLRAAVERALARSESVIAERDRRAAALRLLARLTPRERQVLELVWAGQRNREIAAHLASREATVKVHRSRLMRKLEAHSLVDVVRLGLLVQSAARDRPHATVA